VAVTFALVHGAWHGAWCWERLLEPLRQLGHGAVAVDLLCEDPDAGLDACADSVAAALEGVGGDVVLVAHSLGGLTAPLVAARRPVRALVYLAAFVPEAGRSMADELRSSAEPVLLIEGGRETDEAGRSRWTDAATTAALLYPDLSRADAEWAFAQLRPQARRPQIELHPAGLPDVPAASIVCSGDRVVNPAWSRRVARERLGVEPVDLPAGHFSMIAAPEALAAALASL
jgi:pimeloyl-ACP methyl ester carboxylesterase